MSQAGIVGAGGSGPSGEDLHVSRYIVSSAGTGSIYFVTQYIINI